jgi:hypothetical protein
MHSKLSLGIDLDLDTVSLLPKNFATKKVYLQFPAFVVTRDMISSPKLSFSPSRRPDNATL